MLAEALRTGRPKLLQKVTPGNQYPERGLTDGTGNNSGWTCVTELVGGGGFEPPTNGLKVRCSTPELTARAWKGREFYRRPRYFERVLEKKVTEGGDGRW